MPFLGFTSFKDMFDGGGRGGSGSPSSYARFEVWAKAMGASYVIYHATSGTNPASSDRFFRKLGMTTLGGNYGIKI